MSLSPCEYLQASHLSGSPFSSVNAHCDDTSPVIIPSVASRSRLSFHSLLVDSDSDSESSPVFDSPRHSSKVSLGHDDLSISTPGVSTLESKEASRRESQGSASPPSPLDASARRDVEKISRACDEVKDCHDRDRDFRDEKHGGVSQLSEDELVEVEVDMDTCHRCSSPIPMRSLSPFRSPTSSSHHHF